MSKCREIAEHIEKLCPVNLACEWDNVGLLVGDSEKEIKKVLVCLDVDESVVKECISLGADMIVSHHPIMFSPVNKLTEDDPQQRFIRKMCEKGICHYAAHTNMDCARGGLNDYLAEKLGFSKTEIFEKTADNAGFGRYTEADSTLEDMILLCEEKLNLSSLRYVGEPGSRIRSVVVNSGSGSDALDGCIERGVDLLITGDLKYSVARKAYEFGVCVIDAGHYGTEIIFTELVSRYLGERFKDAQIFISKANTSVLQTHNR